MTEACADDTAESRIASRIALRIVCPRDTTAQIAVD
jgi:hypothetical protein